MTINASKLLPVRTASCSVMGDYAIAKKMNVPFSKAKKGDIVQFDFNHNGTSDHTGIVYAVKGGTIYVVEGNTSKTSNDNGGAVMKRARVKSQVNYLIRPKYTKEVTADMVIATALAEVGTKEKPKNSNKVKYNTWFYGKEVSGSAYPWCEVFVQWCFAHVKEPKESTSTAKKPPATAKKTTKKTAKKTAAKKTAPKKAAVKMTNAQKIVNKAKELAWAYGTHKEKYDYETGAPKKVCKEAMKKYGWADDKAEMSDCGNFASTVVRESGVSKKFKALHGVKTAFPTKEDKFSIPLKGKKIPKGFLKAGDLIRYKKKNGKQHAMIYMGDGKICEASHHNRFGVILKDNGKYNEVSKVKTIQVLRAKG